MRRMATLTFATGPFLSGPEGRPLRRRLGEHLSTSLGEPVHVAAAKTYPQLLAALRQEAAQIAWTPPALFVQAAESHDVQPVLSCQRLVPGSYRGALFARADRYDELPPPAERPTVAWVDQSSCGGFLFPRFALAERKLLPNDYFGDQLMLGTHRGVVSAVARGRADIGATYVHVARGDDAPRSTGWADLGCPVEMRALLLSRPIPSDLVCATREVAERLGDQLAGSLRAIARTDGGQELLEGLFQARSFGDVDRRDYEVVRAALNVAELPSLGQRSHGKGRRGG